MGMDNAECIFLIQIFMNILLLWLPPYKPTV